MENGSQEAQKRPNRYNHMSKSQGNFSEFLFVHCGCGRHFSGGDHPDCLWSVRSFPNIVPGCWYILFAVGCVMQVFSLWRTECALVLKYHAAQVHISDLPFVAISLIWFDPGPLSFCVFRFFFCKIAFKCVQCLAGKLSLLLCCLWCRVLPVMPGNPAFLPLTLSVHPLSSWWYLPVLSSFLQWCTSLLWGNISPGMKVPISPFCHWLLLIRRGDPTCLPSTLSVPKQCPVATQCHSCQLGI